MGCGSESSLESSPTQPDAAEHAKNVFLITVDTLRADRLGCLGNERGLTPCLDRLANEGVVFLEATTPITVTAPAHSSIFTGLYPLTHGLTNNFFQLRSGARTLAEFFQGAGFRTGAFFHVFPFPGARVDQGFEHTYLDESDTGEGLNQEVWRWLDQQPSGQGVFCWVHYFMPHAPIRAPAEFRDRWVQQVYDGPLNDRIDTLEAIRRGDVEPPPEYLEYYREGYDAEVAYTDHVIDQLLEGLQGRGRLKDTLVAVTADHGESLEQGVIGLHAPVIRQATLHVPLILWGASVPSGGRIDRVVELIDLFPTLLRGAGLSIPRYSTGQSLWPLVRSEDVAWDDYAYSMIPTRYRGHDEDEERDEPPALAVRARQWKLIVRGKDEVSLYDLDSDPDERHDLSDTRPQVVGNLRNALEQWLKAVRVPLDEEHPLEVDNLEYLRELGYTTD